jgi:dihydropteroate synthase
VAAPGRASWLERLSELPADGAVAGMPAQSAIAFAGLVLDRPRIMGIVNVTPDSFSDGNETFAPSEAIARGLRHLADGADIVDVGGESTRPGAAPLPIEEELRRVLPVVEALAARGVLVSIDTRHAEVMAAALAAGARIVNDVTALGGDAASLATVAASDASVVLMHMRGEPRTMQADPRYDDVVAEVAAFLADRAAACEAVGIGRHRIAVDPGIGFGKTARHNFTLLQNLGAFRRLGCALLIGVSRKRFIGDASRGEAPAQRLGGSLAAALAAIARGAHIVRVHDVAATAQALQVWRAIEGETP